MCIYIGAWLSFYIYTLRAVSNMHACGRGWGKIYSASVYIYMYENFARGSGFAVFQFWSSLCF